MDLLLQGKRALVTGASRGIGLAAAHALAGEGCQVAMVARGEAALRAAATEVGAEHMAMDCADPDAWENLDAGVFDVIVANVGDGASVPDPLPSREQFAKTWRQNFAVAEETARFAVNGGLGRGGALVFVSSIAGLEEIGAPTDYAVAKAAVEALTVSLGRKLAPHRRVNCVCPGNVLAPGGVWERKLNESPARVQDMLDREVPMGRLGRPEEIAAAIVFLASPVSSFTTGSCVVVDGGQTRGL